MPEGPRYFTLTPEQLAGYELEEDSAKPGKQKEKESKELQEITDDIRQLQEALNNRASEFGITTPPKFESPALPPDFKREHLQVFADVLGQKLEASTMPYWNPLVFRVPDWSGYFNMMLPSSQREEDTKRGLVSKRPDYWPKTADANLVGGNETWGETFERSMKVEAQKFQGRVFLTEPIQKPNYTDGSQKYGTKEGAEDNRDPLLPIIREVLGSEKNRFNNTWDDVTKVVSRVKEKLRNEFSSRGLSVPDFDVVITPAVISGLEMTLRHSENSSTTTYEWCSTPLLKKDEADSGYRLMVGYSGDGGAGYVNGAPRGRAWGRRGFRLSVVLKNT